MYEFTTAIATHAEMIGPKQPEVSGADLAAFFRSQPGYRKQREPKRRRT